MPLSTAWNAVQLFVLFLAFVPLLLQLREGAQIPQPPLNLKPKVFVIGLSKTGTTSLGDALAVVGYKRLGWKDIRSRHLVHSWHHNAIDSLISVAEYYDAFEDLPWPFVYRQMAELFPDSRFILSFRSNESQWLESMRRHVGRARWIGYEYCYGASTIDGNEDVVITRYRNHTADVRSYFQQQPERLLALNIDAGEANWRKLCGFVDCGGGLPQTAFPRSNTTANWGDGDWLGMVMTVWSAIIIWIEETSAFIAYGHSWVSGTRVGSLVWSVVSASEQACSEIWWRTESLIAHSTALLSTYYSEAIAAATATA